MRDGEIPRELLKETSLAKKASEVVMKFEMGIQNQLKMSGTVVNSTSNELADMSINSIHTSFKIL